MTLILTVANKNGICQSSDYQLTNSANGRFVSDKAGSKQIRAMFDHLSIDLSFTGIAGFGTTKTVDFLSQELQKLPYTSTLDNICKALEVSCNRMVSGLPYRWLVIVLAVETVGKPYKIAVISNATWKTKAPTTNNYFSVNIYTITKPFSLISGYRSCVPFASRMKLKLLSRSIGKPNKDVSGELAAINAISAQNSKGIVSEKCWVVSQFSEGNTRHTTARNIEGEGIVPNVFPGFDMMKWIKENFQNIPGKQISTVVTASVMGGGKPIPPPEGEPRTFMLSGTEVSGYMHSMEGLLAFIRVMPINLEIIARCNEEMEGAFATVEITPLGSVGADFAARLPFPVLKPIITINGNLTPRPWELPISYNVENRTCNVTFPFTSGALRNIAFLGEDDELAIAFPVNDIRFKWTEVGGAFKDTFIARIWWRKRLDGTKG